MKGLLWNETPVLVENQQITEIPSEPGLKHIAPGLVDIQVNGFGGVDFNDPTISGQEAVERNLGLKKD